MPELVLVATLTPAEGKADRLEEVLQSMAKTVHASEPDVLRYEINRQTDATGTPLIVMLETYKNESALKSHGESEHMAELLKVATAEKLLAKGMDIVTCAPVGGFASRL